MARMLIVFAIVFLAVLFTVRLVGVLAQVDLKDKENRAKLIKVAKWVGMIVFAFVVSAIFVASLNPI